MGRILRISALGTLYMEPHGPGKGVAGYVRPELSEGCIEERGTRSCFWEAGHTPMDYGHDGGWRS